MTKETKIPALRFPEFEGEWVEKRLGEVCTVKTGNKDTQDKVEDGIYPFYVRSDTVERMNSYTYDGEAILTSGDGVGVGKNFHYVTGKFAYHQRVYALYKFDINTHGLFVYQVFSEKFNKRVMRLSAKNSVDSVRMDMITDMVISFPSLPEQEKIASFLAAVDERLQLLEQKKKQLEEYKKGAMQQLFSQQIRFQNEDGNDYPDWEEKRADKLFKSHSNKSHNGDLPILAATQDMGVVPRNIIGIDIQSTQKSVDSYKIVEKGDFVISLRSFQGGIEYSEYYGICSPAYTILKPKIEVVNLFYKQYFKDIDFIGRLANTAIGIRDGKQISYASFSSLKLPYPTPMEQQQIADFLSAIDNKITICQKEIEGNQEYKKGLLQQMFV